MGEHVRISHFRNHYEVSRVGLEAGHGSEQRLAGDTGMSMEKYKGIGATCQVWGMCSRSMMS